ncbi:MAG: nucleotidyltransferase family protein [Deltaproteobacteria bacterium]|nr:nucleotidyltransferase family protein [Deltaproteobacteria bacterium]
MMKAMILAAGLGTRLQPHTHHTPKPLLQIHGEPILYYTLRWLKHYGVQEVWVNLHHLGEQIEKILGEGSRFGLTIRYSKENSLLGTAGGVRHAVERFKNQRLLVVNSDFVSTINLKALMEYHHKKGGMATLVLRKNPDPSLYGKISIDRQGRIRDLLGRLQPPFKDLKELMFTGIQILEPELIQEIPSGNYSLTDLYLKAIEKDKPLYGRRTEEWWVDLGTLEQFDKAPQQIKREQLPFYLKGASKNYVRDEKS